MLSVEPMDLCVYISGIFINKHKKINTWTPLKMVLEVIERNALLITIKEYISWFLVRSCHYYTNINFPNWIVLMNSFSLLDNIKLKIWREIIVLYVMKVHHYKPHNYLPYMCMERNTEETIVFIQFIDFISNSYPKNEEPRQELITVSKSEGAS